VYVYQESVVPSKNELTECRSKSWRKRRRETGRLVTRVQASFGLFRFGNSVYQVTHVTAIPQAQNASSSFSSQQSQQLQRWPGRPNYTAKLQLIWKRGDTFIPQLNIPALCRVILTHRWPATMARHGDTRSPSPVGSTYSSSRRSRRDDDRYERRRDDGRGHRRSRSPEVCGESLPCIKRRGSNQFAPFQRRYRDRDAGRDRDSYRRRERSLDRRDEDSYRPARRDRSRDRRRDDDRDYRRRSRDRDHRARRDDSRDRDRRRTDDSADLKHKRRRENSRERGASRRSSSRALEVNSLRPYAF